MKHADGIYFPGGNAGSFIYACWHSAVQIITEALVLHMLKATGRNAIWIGQGLSALENKDILSHFLLSLLLQRYKCSVKFLNRAVASIVFICQYGHHFHWMVMGLMATSGC